MDNEKAKIEEIKSIDEKTKSLSYEVKSEVKCLECRLSYHIRRPDGTVDEQNGAPANENEKVEQERTRVKKKLFLEFYEQIRVKSVVYKKIVISERQVERWMIDDKEFAKAVSDTEIKRNEAVKDVILGKIFLEHDGPTARWWMERRDPDFKTTSVTEIITPTTTLKQAVDTIQKNLNEINAGTNKQPMGINKPGDHPIDVEDKKQEGGVSEVQTKPGPDVLLGKKDEKKLDTKSPAEGNK